MVNSSRPDELVDGVFGRLASHVLPLYWLLLGLLGISNVLLGQGRGGREGREKGRRVSSAALHQENVEALILPDWSDHVVVDRGVLFKA